jgi:hypothetical protein
MSAMEALTIPGVDAGIWQVRHRFDPAAAALYARHYSVETATGRQVGGPGYVLVLVTPCERAAWVTKRHSPLANVARVTADGYPPDTYRCALFRNEGAGLSSDLIRSAMEISEERWGAAPHGWQTYVDAAKVASANPGYCFKRAGWVGDGCRGTKLSFIHPSLSAVAFLTPDPKGSGR